jgi:hypothetical protein
VVQIKEHSSALIDAHDSRDDCHPDQRQSASISLPSWSATKLDSTATRLEKPLLHVDIEADILIGFGAGWGGDQKVEE